MKISLDQKKCIGCGSCAAACPEYFKMNSNGKSELVKKNTDKTSQDLKDAVEVCPVQCIKLD